VGDDAEAIALPSTTIGIAAAPVERPHLEGIDLSLVVAARATHAVRPTPLHDVGFAGIVSGELLVELLEGQHD
jgi:hypothetical protein